MITSLRPVEVKQIILDTKAKCLFWDSTDEYVPGICIKYHDTHWCTEDEEIDSMLRRLQYLESRQAMAWRYHGEVDSAWSNREFTETERKIVLLKLMK